MSDNKEEEKTKFVSVDLGLNMQTSEIVSMSLDIQMRKNIDQIKKIKESKDTKIEMKTEKQPVFVKKEKENEGEKGKDNV